jgi:secondary thiamine-phosphate synthase enzyme
MLAGVDPPSSRLRRASHPGSQEWKMTTLSVRTQARNELVDITAEVQRVVSAAKLADGVCTVFVPHTTAAVTINENADPSVKRDVLQTLSRMVPEDGDYDHGEVNSDAHVKATLVGPSVQIIIAGHQLQLGRWQGIYFCEFDGPRSRHVFVDAK